MKRRTEQLIQSAFDGELEENREAELAEALRESPSARSAWCEHALLVRDLQRIADPAQQRPGSMPPSVAYFAARQKRRQVIGSLSAAAAAVIVAAAVLAAVFIEPGSQQIGVTLSKGTVLEGKGDSQLDMGDSLVIRQGAVRLDFPGDVVGIIEGPTRLVIESDSRVRLTGGRGHFTVPSAARGFTVTGPTLEVVDLGTEFGVDFREPGRASVSVMRGKVRVRALRGRTEQIELGRNEAVTLTPIGSFTPDASPAPYLTRLPEDLQEARLNFDRIEDGMLPMQGDLLNAAESRVRIVESEPQAVSLVPGVVGSALAFRGDAELISDWPGIHGTEPRTVSLWFRLQPGADYRSAPPLVLWGLPGSVSNDKFKLAVVEAEGAIRTRISLGGWYANGSAEISDDQWHHLAAVWSGLRPDGSPEIQIYLDGQRDELSHVKVPVQMRFGTDTLSPRSHPLSIGRYELTFPSGHPYFRGAIDELRIVAGALDAEEIARLAEIPGR